MTPSSALDLPEREGEERNLVHKRKAMGLDVGSPFGDGSKFAFLSGVIWYWLDDGGSIISDRMG